MQASVQDVQYMKRCLELAAQGQGFVAPNPMVGAVIVHNDSIIGEGYHRKYGDAHAEVNAVNSVDDKSLLKESTIYVSLEPCSHHGKTPPCCDLIILQQFKRVVVAMQDPFPLVSGRGIEKIRANGIQVDVGILEDEAKELNKQFIYFHTQKKPWIRIKWAETADGFIDKERTLDDKPLSITNSLVNTFNHKERAKFDTILVGYQTALKDNPKLNVRHWNGRSPIRVVFDRDNNLPKSLHLFNDGQPTWIINSVEDREDGSVKFIKTEWENKVDFTLNLLYKNDKQSLLIEGGKELISRFIESNNYNEIWRFKSHDLFIESGILAPTINLLPTNQITFKNNSLYLYTS